MPNTHYTYTISGGHLCTEDQGNALIPVTPATTPRFSYRDTVTFRLHFPMGAFTPGDTLLLNLDKDRNFLHSNKMAEGRAEITAADIATGYADVIVRCTYPAFADAVNGARFDLNTWIEVARVYADGEDADGGTHYAQQRLSLDFCFASPVVGLITDTPVPIEPQDYYYTKDQTDKKLAAKADLDEDGKVPASELPSMDYIPTSEKNVANGVAGLDANGKVASAMVSPYYNIETVTDLELVIVPGHAYFWNLPQQTSGKVLSIHPDADLTKAWKSTLYTINRQPEPTHTGIDFGTNEWDNYTSRVNTYEIICDGSTVMLKRVIYGDTTLDNGITGTVATNNNYGWGRIGNCLSVYNSNNQVDGRSRGIALGLQSLDYAVRGVADIMSDIPSDAASPIVLLDRQDNSNNHSCTYCHVPSSSPTYALPEVRSIAIGTGARDEYIRHGELDGATYFAWGQYVVNGNFGKVYTASEYPAVGDNCYTNTALTSGRKAITALTPSVHRIRLFVKYSADVLSCAFQDAEGNTITPIDSVVPVAGEVIRYDCEYSNELAQWVVFAKSLTRTAQAGVSDVRIEGSTASLVTDGVAEIPIGGESISKKGIVFAGDDSIGINAYGGIYLKGKATNNEIDARSTTPKERHFIPATTTLDYAVRSVQPNITSIDADATEYSLLDASATTNNHSWTYAHTPEASCTYTLPEPRLMTLQGGTQYFRLAASDGTGYYAWQHTNSGAKRYTATTVPNIGDNAYSDTALSVDGVPVTSLATDGNLHHITLYIKHTTTGINATFKDVNGTAITPIGGNYNPSANEVVEYDCQWVDALSQWVIQVKSKSNAMWLPITGLVTGDGITYKNVNSRNTKIYGGSVNIGYSTDVKGDLGSLNVGRHITIKSGRVAPGYGASGFGDYLQVGYHSCVTTGKYNVCNDNPLTIGNGTSSDSRSNAIEITWQGAIRQYISTIPSTATEYALPEGTFSHSPETAPTYTLPEMHIIVVAGVDYTRSTIDDGDGYYGWTNGTTKKYTASATPTIGDNSYTNTALTVGAKVISDNKNRMTHSIFLTIDMANTASVVFQDAEGTAITPSLAGGTPAVGDVWQFMCEYSVVQNKWLVLGYKEG